MRDIQFSEDAESQLGDLPKKIQQRIVKKIYYYAQLQDPRSTAKPMINYAFGQRRRRIGDYRVIFDIHDDGHIVIIVVIGHRKHIYN